MANLEQESWYPETYAQWQHMTKGEKFDETLLRPEITASWQRSIKLGVSSSKQQAQVVSLGDLPNYEMNADLLKNAANYLRRLYRSVVGSSFLLCLTDKNGWILDLKGDQYIRRVVESMHFVPGSNWAEGSMGSSGIGISLATVKPVQVMGSEHYLQTCHPLACAAAPIFGHDGQLLGSVNITADVEQYHPHTFGMVVAAADAISTDIIHRQKYWHGFQADQKRVKSKGSAYYSFDDIIGESSAIKGAIEEAKKASYFPCNLLILGESGTGKELFAQAIHNASDRSAKGFVAVNSAAIPKELAASEFFGYVDGAFTGARRNGAPGKFELANDGTLFLDEIGDMPLHQQTSLLRVLEEGELTRIGGQQSIPINVRVISASNQDLNAMIQEKTFRRDLFYRLNGLTICLPPLRERGDDIELLANFFVERLLPERELKFTDAALLKLKAYHWPGNVRELKNTINQALFRCDGSAIDADDIQFVESEQAPPLITTDLSLKKMEALMIDRAMEVSDGDVNCAAQMLGINPTTLYRKLKK